MYASVMENCDKELVRKMTQHKVLNACVVLFSSPALPGQLPGRSGMPAGAISLHKARKRHSTFTAYTTGVLRSRKGACDAILPETIDVSRYRCSLSVHRFWPGNLHRQSTRQSGLSPAARGKKAVVFVTSCGQPGEALPLLRTSLASRGVEVVSECCLTQDDMESQNAGNDLIGRIVAAYPSRQLKHRK